ncbi:MAG: hypothetical protein AAF573_00930 [Bacteroidota bacterium]
MVIVDSSDGLMKGITVDKTVPENVAEVLNIYQTETSGASSRSQSSSNNPSDSDYPSSSEHSSSDGTSDSIGSRGFPHSAENPAATKVFNVNATRQDINHGNIQDKQRGLIQTVINNHVQNNQ